MSAIAPLVAADDGLVVLTFIGPAGKNVGDTIDINIETYLNGVATNVDTLDVSVGFGGGASFTFTNLSTGKYHTTYQIDANDSMLGSLIITGSADLGVASGSIFEFYTVGSGGGGGGGWEVSARLLNHPMGGFDVQAGDHVTVEARSYNMGTLADGGQINMSMIASTSGFTGGPPMGGATPLNVTKVSAGVYQAVVDVPATITTSNLFFVTATLGTGLLAPSDETTFFANPFRVMTVVTGSTSTTGSLKVYVGGDAPVAGAQVSLTGMSIMMTPPYFTQVGPFSATTDANGQASLTATWTAGQSVTTWNLNVSSGGKMSMGVVAFASGSTTAWVPSPPIGYGCEANIQTDTSKITGGQTANMVFRVTSNGAPVSSQSITRFVYLDGATGTSQAGNVTTDATGNFTVTYAVPSPWTFDNSLKVEVYCPDGTSDTAFVSFSTSGAGFGTGTVTVSASGQLGGAVAVTGNYAGSNALTNAQAFAAILPGNSTNFASGGFTGGGLIAPMTRSGNTFSGSVTVPAWLGSGDYTVIVVISNDGATSSTSDQTTEGNTTVIHLTPQGSTGGNNGTPAKGFLPGFEGAAGIAAVGAAGALLVVSRRRREL